MFYVRSIRKGAMGRLGLAALSALTIMSFVGAEPAKAQNVEFPPFGGNFDANAGGIGPGLDASALNAALGFINGSGNANSVILGPAGVNAQIANLWIGAANGSGNANQLFSTLNLGFPLNAQALNFQTGIANGSGNSFVIQGNGSVFSDSPILDTTLLGIDFDNQAIADFAGGLLETGGIPGLPIGEIPVLHASALNNYAGIGNGSLNGVVLNHGTSLSLQALNSADGIGNFSANANILQLGNIADAAGCLQGLPGAPTPDDIEGCVGTSAGGNSFSVIANNTAFGNLNGTGNANNLAGEGTAALAFTNNRIFGDLNASFNGNGGFETTAIIDNNFIVGTNSVGNNGNNPEGPAYAEITDNTVLGSNSLTNNGDAGTSILMGNTIFGSNSANFNGNNFNYNKIIGSNSGNGGGNNVTYNTVVGDDSGNGYANGATSNFVYGNDSGNNVNGANNIAIGNFAGNDISASNSIAIGTNSQAAGNSGIAIGNNAFAAGPNDTALGAGATVTADNSTAIGAGAVASLPNQVVLGTRNETYKAPGITSQKSKNRQSGPLEIVTSDANGNLATDGGATFAAIDNNTRRINENRRGISKNRSGVALAMAMDNPDLVGNEQFGVAGHYSIFDGASGLGFTALGVVGHDFITEGDRFALSGGFGVGFNDVGDDGWGGRVGGQWTWGHVN